MPSQGQLTQRRSSACQCADATWITPVVLRGLRPEAGADAGLGGFADAFLPTCDEGPRWCPFPQLTVLFFLSLRPLAAFATRLFLLASITKPRLNDSFHLGCSQGGFA